MDSQTTNDSPGINLNIHRCLLILISVGYLLIIQLKWLIPFIILNNWFKFAGITY
jgi:hypothetical protein